MKRILKCIFNSYISIADLAVLVLTYQYIGNNAWAFVVIVLWFAVISHNIKIKLAY